MHYSGDLRVDLHRLAVCYWLRRAMVRTHGYPAQRAAYAHIAVKAYHHLFSAGYSPVAAVALWRSVVPEDGG